jgi:hypothetical protein
VNELKQAIAIVLELASQMIDELDDQTMLALTDLLNAAAERLTQMKQNPVEGLQPQASQENIKQSMPSSNVEGFAYDDKNGNLLVRFLGDYPNRNGPIYSYGGVPKEIFDLFQKGAIPARTDGKNKWGKWWKGKVPSIGASLYTLIKERGYPYQRLS